MKITQICNCPFTPCMCAANAPFSGLKLPACPLLQVGYAAVFFWEYFGPLLLYNLVYFLPQLAYPGQKYAVTLGTVASCTAHLTH